jgi:flagellar biosynthesis/type III secretory pathway M-ring protein FliF/YscJ
MSCSELQNQEVSEQIDKINNLVSDYVGEIKINNNDDKPNTDCIPGTLCYAQNITQQLKDAYLAALEKVRVSPIELRDAEKNYVTNTEGTYGYHQLLVKRATKVANDEAVKLFDKFMATLNETTYITETLQAVNTINRGLTLSSGEAATSGLQDDVNNLNIDNITKNRKSYYELEEYDNLKKWYLFWFYIYIFLLLVFGIAMFLTNSDYSFMSKLGFLTLFILYLFGIRYIIYGLIFIYIFLTNLFPKNIYMNI